MAEQQITPSVGPAVSVDVAPPAVRAVAGGDAAGGLPEGVLPPAGASLAWLVGLVAVVAAAEAAWNLGLFVLTVLHLPLLLAVTFPLLAEAAAMSFALQDLRDRRRGHPSRAMRAATYLTLASSAAVNGAVGLAAHGAAGLLEVIPPIVLGVVTHLHGERATRAWHSQARLRPAWRAAQLRTAQVSSAIEVLPLLAGTDVDGRATVDLLRSRLDSQTLEPAQALLAAGWHERGQRGLTRSQIRRLEIVASTVWDATGPPPDPTPTASPVASPRSSPVASPTTSPTTSPVAATDPAPGRRGGGRRTPSPADGQAAAAGRVSASDDRLGELVAAARAARPGAGEGSVRQLLAEAGLTASAKRIRAALAHHEAAPVAEVTGETGPRPGLHLVPGQVVGELSGPAEGLLEASVAAGEGGDVR